MRRPLAALAIAAASVAALAGCVVMPPAAGSGDFGFVGGSATGPYDPAYDDVEFDAAAEEEWQDENHDWELDYADWVAEDLRSIGSQLPPAEGESLESFRHLIVGVSYEWCDRLYVDEERSGDAGEHADLAARYGWSVEEYAVVADSAEIALCGY